MAATASRNGESSIIGSARRMRFASAMSTGRQNRPQPHLAAQLYPAGGANQGELPSERVSFFLQTKRPNGAFLEFLFGLVQGFDCFHQIGSLLLDLGGE